MGTKGQRFLVAITSLKTLMSCLAMALTKIATDQSALLAFKSGLNLDPSHVLSQNWSDSSPTCEWIGVTCGSRHHRLIALDISEMGLKGNLPTQLGNISFLVSLNLRNNSFRGQLPEELAKLHRLRFLDFGFNSFTGNIPSWFGILIELRFLNLRNNGFTGPIPSFITNMSKLEVLDTSFNPLQGEIAEAFGSLFNLKDLRLQSNNLNGVIPMSVLNISAMENLVLTGNSLSGNLPEGMCSRLSNLKTLYLSSNGLEGPIPPNISECSQLTVLSLSRNKFTGSIPRDIGSLMALELLFLSFNHLTGEIPKEIGNLEKLVELRMGDNLFEGSLPSSICNSSSLQYINIADCNLTGSIPSDMCSSSSSQLQAFYFYGNNLTGSIPKGIGNLTMLQMLYIGFNKMTGTIPEGIENLNNLRFFDLSYNYLSGYIPEKIFNISSLRSIVVSSNRLLGHLPSILNYGLPNIEVLYLDHNFFFGEITDSLSNSSKLISLDFSFNNLSGQVPNSFGKLNLLEILLLSANSFVSETSELSFITSLTNCSNLKELSIAANPFNGALPVSIGNMSSSIQKFFAYNCGLQGSIPDGLGNLENLIILSLFRNEFTGALPNTLENLRKLQGFSLHHNKVSGSIPTILCTLQDLNLFSVRSNKITGSIPDCIGNLTSLRILYLKENRLSSVIPTSLWKLKDILVLNLSSNLLTGSLPSDIENLKALNFFDLSENQFAGIIPSSIGLLESIIDLSLARNKFEGSIPESISKLVSLEELDLSHNNLSGTIPVSLETLQYLKYFDVSFNKLSGPIPTGGPFKSLSSRFFMSNGGLCGDSKYGVPHCDEKTIKSKRKKVILPVVYVFIGIAGLLFAITLSYILVGYRKKNKTETPTAGKLNTAPSRVSYQELVKATEGFNGNHLLGTGSYGSVYKGTLEDGEDVAVKVFNLHLEGGFKSFDTECEVLRRLRHRNLCRVIGSCSNEDFKALVLQYMPNGSLDQRLYLENNCLNIVQRLSIMIDIACALEYLHHGYSIPIIHCDLKPSNVLLDEDMVAHLSDFGIAKLLNDGVSLTLTRTLATLGYIAPEYGSEGLVSAKCDVYSYGIMLMEVFTKTKPDDVKFTGDLSLWKWVNDHVPNAIMQVIDSELLNDDQEFHSEKIECLVSTMSIALKCSVENPRERNITMESVVVSLKKIMSQLLQYAPKQVSNL